MKIIKLPVIILLAILGWLATGCSKDGGKCVSNSGRIIKQDRHLSAFDSIRVLDNVSVILMQGSPNQVVVEAGENIIDGIVTKLSGTELVLSNANTCNWLRSYSKPVNVFITTANLLKIYYESSGDMTNADTLRSDSLVVDLWGGCGTIDLRVRLGQGSFILHQGNMTVKLHGICNVSNVYAGDFGLLELGDLKTGYSFVTNNGSNDCYVNASRELQATIQSIGNIYYTGNPTQVKTTITGSGQVISY